MTQPNDPWAAASAAPAPAQATVTEQPASPMAAGFGAAAGGSLLFQQRNAAPSLMNKTHPLGTVRGGVIIEMNDVQDQDYNTQSPKYWSASRTGGPNRNGAITTDAIDAPTGKPNRPVMVTHITLETEYRMDLAEATASARNGNVRDISTDDGKRVEVVSGLDMKAFTDAMVDARARGITLAAPADLIGKRLDVKRASQRPNPGGNPSWIKAYRIDNA